MASSSTEKFAESHEPLASALVRSTKYRPSRCFLQARVVCDGDQVNIPDVPGFEAMLVDATQAAFGTCGSARLTWHVVMFDARLCMGILRVNPKDLQHLRLALTLVSTCHGRRCRVDVTRVVSSLAALASSRCTEEVPDELRMNIM